MNWHGDFYDGKEPFQEIENHIPDATKLVRVEGIVMAADAENRTIKIGFLPDVWDKVAIPFGDSISVILPKKEKP